MNAKVLIIGLVWPEPETTAAGSRMMQLIRLFSAKGMGVHFASTALKTSYSCALDRYGVSAHNIQVNDSSFDSWIKELQPDIVVFDRFVTEEQFSWRVKEHSNSAIRILDTEDLHLLREARRLALEEKKSDWTDFLLNDITLRELASICRSDLTLVISEVEYNLLKDHFKIDESLLHYLPFLFEEYEIPTGGSLAGYAERRDFMTMGNWKHGPNRDSILYLKNEVWTEVRKRMPKAHMHVYGAYGKDKDLAMNDPSAGFFIHGWANSKGEAYSRHRVCLAPIRYGAGLKGKLIDAMRFGIPSVTTPIGAEGLAGDLPWNGFVSDDPSQMAALASELYNNKEVWENCQMRGETILRARFLGDLFEPGLIKVIAAIRASFEIHRTRNVMGALLWHHNAQSTKYLSKWIEVKNKFRDQNH